MIEPYDSTADTQAHIKRVQELIEVGRNKLAVRAAHHDASKLQEPEKSVFDKYTPLLRHTTYGSEEYKSFLAGMQTGLQHHYANNSHHPEHYELGIDGMSLFDIQEMLIDWKAATERHADGSIWKSLEINRIRFSISDQMYSVLVNTAREMGW